MNINIVENLFPNLLTMATQLAATFVLYKLYKKYVHDHVLAYLSKQEAQIEAANTLAEVTKQEALDLQADLKLQRITMLDKINELEKQLKAKAEIEYQEKLALAESQIASKQQEMLDDIESQKRKMMADIEKYASELAFEMSKKVLSNYEMTDEVLLARLAEKLEHPSA